MESKTEENTKPVPEPAQTTLVLYSFLTGKEVSRMKYTLHFLGALMLYMCTVYLPLLYFIQQSKQMWMLFPLQVMNYILWFYLGKKMIVKKVLTPPEEAETLLEKQELV